MRKDGQHFWFNFRIDSAQGRTPQHAVHRRGRAGIVIAVGSVYTYRRSMFFVKISQVPWTRHFVRATTSAGDAIDVTVAAAG